MHEVRAKRRSQTTSNMSLNYRVKFCFYFILFSLVFFLYAGHVCGKRSPYSITERRIPELIPVLGSQPASDVSHKPGGRLPLLSSRPAVTTATFKRAATNFAAWRTEARWA